MASPVILSNATNSPDVTGEDVALMERRRALKEGAFVRYSNADMLEKLRASPQSRSPTGSKSPMRGKKERDMASNRLTKSTNGLVIPGNLYQSRAESPNLTSPHAHLHDMPSPSRTEGTLLLRETVDGIGHASVPNLKTLRGVKPLTSLSIPPVTPDSSERLPPLTASKSIPVIELEGKVGEQVASHHPSSSPSAFHRKTYHESFNDEGLNVLLQSNHWKKNQRASKLIPLAAVHLDSSSSSAQTATVLPESAAEAIALVTQEALDVQRQKALQIKLQKEREAVEALLKNTGQKPGLLDDDSLNLWQGKRLTGAEMKVEQRLHVLRNNPAANKDLKEKVLSYIDEKHQEHQERQALAEFAVERRELKTIQFLSRRFKQSTSPKKNQAEPGGSTSPPPATSDLFNSVYDPSTGEPRMDTIPLPISSMFFWSGMTRLTQTLEVSAADDAMPLTA